MRFWDLTTADPLSLFLAADARFCAPDYTDDQIWELIPGGGDPPAMAAETMLGLRAVGLRLFPVFVVGSRPIHNPADFFSPPAVRRFAPNYLQIDCRPVAGLEAACEYWVPESHGLAGRITLRAEGVEPVRGEFRLAGILRPAAEGTCFAGVAGGPLIGMYLRGRVMNFHPVVVMAGANAVGRGSIPSLKIPLEADPGRPQTIRWAFACRPSAEAGLILARSLLEREWEGEIARIELAGESLLDIETGQKDWDAVLAFSQTAAIQSLVGPTAHLSHPSPVAGRNPERGYSLRGDGSDYAPGWGGAGLFDLLMGLPVWALAKPEAAKDLLRNFLETAGEGSPDARPGAGRQRAGLLAPPLLAQAAWRAMGGREDAGFLEALWPLVDRYLDQWFDPAHDRDQDGAPEWDRIDSLGPEVEPMFARIDPWGGWILPAEAESPSLAALLLGECHAAVRMAERCGAPDRAQHWRRRADDARRSLERMLVDGEYRAVDRVTHQSPTGRTLWEGSPGDCADCRVRLDPPARILLRCLGGPETQPTARRGTTARAGVLAVVRGKNERGEECGEEFTGDRFGWAHGSGACFSRTVWSSVTFLHTEGPSPDTTFRLEVPGLRREDLSHFLPLWSREVPPARAEKLFARLAAKEGYSAPSGLRFVPAADPAAGKEPADGVWMVWNMLMGEAAIRYGKTELARDWIERWMRTLALSLRTDRSFRACYAPASGAGSGPRNSLKGIFPVGLFLAALGVHPVSSGRVWVGGRSIFPFAVTVRYKGMTMTRRDDSLQVEFPSGGRREFRGTHRTLIEEERE
jgi:hypothetical protein